MCDLNIYFPHMLTEKLEKIKSSADITIFRKIVEGYALKLLREW